MTRARASAAVLIAAIALSIVAVNPEVRGDGNGYFAWLASPIVDHDLDFTNQFRHSEPLFKSAYFDDAGALKPDRVTVTGHIEDQWAIGPAVLWSPWFLAAHAYVVIRRIDPQDGFAAVYRRACAVGTLFYALMAMWLSARAARRLGLSHRAALIAAGSLWGASSLLVYVYLLPFHVHAMAAFTVSLFLWYGLSHDGAPARGQWIVWGALGGLMGMTYQADSVFILAVVPAALATLRRRGRVSSVVDGALFLAAAIAAAAPQWIGKWIVYGSPLKTGYRDGFFWTSPRLWDTSFSTNHGVILWTPIVALGIAGCLWLARRRRDVWGVVLASTVFYFVIASYSNWHGLSSFGNRFFISCTLPLLIGVSTVVDAVWTRGRAAQAALVAGLMMLIVWNAGLAFQWASKMIPNRGPASFATVVSQQRGVPRRAVSFGYRYFTDRAGLRAEIEAQDQSEWRSYKTVR